MSERVALRRPCLDTTGDKITEGANSMTSQKITPCLWFEGNAPEAVRFYISVFPNSSIE